MESAEGQLALIQVWADGTSFKVDSARSPKANFAGLAKAQGWVGGDAEWRWHWEACFKELYLFGRGGERSLLADDPASVLSTVLMTADASPAPTAHRITSDLVERSRRLSNSSENSIVSIESDFSFISGAPSIQSLDTNGSIIGGIALGLESISLEPAKNGPPTTVTKNQQSKVPAASNLSTEEKESGVDSSATDGSQAPPEGSPFWRRYPGFEPNPRAPFKHELGRLCRHTGAKTKKDKKNLQTEALTAEIKYHYGAHMKRLDRWQELCEEVGIEKIPTTITQCQKVLKPVFVNLFNLVDHRRNPDLKVLRFQSYGEFSKFTRKGNEFPRNCAKEEGFIKVLLKKI